MRYIFKIILLSSFLLSSLLANTHIDEYKSDLYYANGIGIGVPQYKAKVIWNRKANNLLYNNPEAKKSIENIAVSYNTSQGKFDDFLESFTQINTYKNSIRLGHGVIVIAHSQGNLYTNEAYNALSGNDEWMRKYFHMMGVATPADHVAGGGPYVTFDNDPIHSLPGSLNANLINQNRYYSYTNALGEYVEGFTTAFHSFNYYLGIPTIVGDKFVSTTQASTLIQNFIFEKIEEHKNADSQWEIADKYVKLVEEFKRLTKQSDINKKLWEMLMATGRYEDVEITPSNFGDYISKEDIELIFKLFTDKKVTLKHKYDQYNMDKIENVYPFNLDKKLYMIPKTTDYVLASSGANKIFKHESKYELNNYDKEWISVEKPFLAVSTTHVYFDYDGNIESKSVSSEIAYSMEEEIPLSIVEDTSDILVSILPVDERKNKKEYMLYGGCFYFLSAVFDGYKFFVLPIMDSMYVNHSRSFSNKINNEFFNDKYPITF